LAFRYSGRKDSLIVRVLPVFAAVCFAAHLGARSLYYGVFWETPEQIETYIQQQQTGKMSNEAFEEQLKQDVQHTCRNGNVIIDHIQQVGRVYQFLGKTVRIFAVRILAILPLPGQSEPFYQKLNAPIDAYTPIAMR
jgi:hypothetical protein